MMTEASQWVLGGKNIDEDPLFSEYYLSDSAKAYGTARAFYNGFTEAYYIPADAADRLAASYLEKLIKNPGWMQKNLADTRIVLDEIEQFVDTHSAVSVQTMSIVQLRKLYAQQRRLTQKLYTLSRAPQALDRGSDLFTAYILEQLREAAGDEASTLFACLTSPLGTSRFEQAELHENEIVNQLLASATNIAAPVRMTATTEQIKRVNDLAKSYGHIAYHGYGKRVILTANDFWSRIQCKVTAGKQLPMTVSANKKHAQLKIKQHDLVHQFELSQQFQELLTLYGMISLAKINRRFAQIKNFVLLDAIIARLSELQSIPEVVLRFMTQDEFSGVFDGDIPDVAAVQKRCETSVWTYENNSVTIACGSAAYEQFSLRTIPVEMPQTNLAGTVVSMPNRQIRGRARVIFRAEDVFTPGDILVSEATDPDLIDHIRNASAVLTEQGGVTSHASILTRELEVPCIVGVASLLCSIQDNDLLEIDTKAGTIVNFGQQQSNIISLSHIDTATPEEFGGKGYGLWKLHSIGLGSYLPQTYLVRSTFSEKNAEDVQNITLVGSSLQNNKVAIRSSSLLEDGNSMSWAGQFPTFLDVAGDAAQIMEKLSELLAWRIANDYSNGEAASDAPMSAVVQEQIDSLYSGVCFTKCPVQNDTSLIIIELAAGMGDQLVSGKNIPDRIVYSKNKAEFVEISSDKYPSAVSQALIGLVSAAQRADQHWGKPVDIEFAIDKQYNLKLLQCRPITS